MASGPPKSYYEKRRPSGPMGPAGPTQRRPSGPVGPLGVTSRKLSMQRPSIYTIASVGSEAESEAEAEYYRIHGHKRRQSRIPSIIPDVRPRLSIYSLHTLHMEGEDAPAPDLKCGYPCYQPDWLQKLNNPKMLLLCICWMNMSQGFMIGGTLGQATSQLERRFDFSSTDISLIQTAYDVWSGLIVIPLGFIGIFKHKPRVLGFGALSLAFAGFLFVLPHIMAGEYPLGTISQADTCTSANATDPLCELGSSNKYLYFTIFYIAQFFAALGGSCIMIMATPLLDENIPPNDLPVYVGAQMGANTLGPALSMVGGSRFLNMYVDIGRVNTDDVILQPEDPAWVGAYWIGFLIASAMLLISAFFWFCWDYETPQARINAMNRVSEAHAGAGLKETRAEGFGDRIKEIPYGMKILLTNPVVLVATFVGVLELGTVAGLMIFLPKFIQFQFSQTPASASLTVGALLVPAALTGLMVGGWLAKKLHLKIKGLLIMSAIAGFCTVPLTFTFLLKCETIPLAGVLAPYGNDSADTSYTDAITGCNADCGCFLRKYDPVCGVDGKVYFSPCHAGCREAFEFGEEEDEHFFDCSCIAEPSPSWDVGQAEKGICNDSCTNFYIFLGCFFFLVVGQFFGGSATLSSLMRCVPEKERTMAMAVQQVFTRLLGMVPLPILLGVIFDTACEIEEKKCGDTGSCWVYDGDFLAIGISVWVAFAKFAATCGYVAAIKLYKPPPEEEAMSPTERRMSMLSTLSGFRKDSMQINGIAPYDNTIAALEAIGEEEDFEEEEEPAKLNGSAVHVKEKEAFGNHVTQEPTPLGGITEDDEEEEEEDDQESQPSTSGEPSTSGSSNAQDEAAIKL